jgi:hypothetical protein
MRVLTSPDERRLRNSIRGLILFFIFAITVSGITAFPIEAEMALVYANIRAFPGFLQDWLTQVYFAVRDTNDKYPFLAYGTDWLAFAHLIIAMLFIGPLRDPVRNIWVVQWGMLCCVAVFPLAFIAGPIRGIPFYWQLVDCSFGVVGFILLWICHEGIKKLERIRR